MFSLKFFSSMWEYLILSCFLLQVAANNWLTQPCTDGAYFCSSKDGPLNITNEVIRLRDCEYFSCPSVRLRNCNVEMYNVKFIQPTLVTEQAVLTLTLQSNGTLENIVMDGCRSEKVSGACIRVELGSDITINKASFVSFTVVEAFAAVFVRNAILTCNYCFFRLGQTEGAALEATGVSSRVNVLGGGCSFITGHLGACLKADAGAMITASEITASNLVATNAGSVAYASNNAKIEIYRSSLTNNTASEQAGCVYATGASISLFHSIVYNCSCYSKHCFGGMGVIQTGSSMSLENTTFSLNKAERYAGLVYALNDITLRISRCRISQSTAIDGDGGAVLVAGINCRFISANNDYTHCSASGKGGAIFLSTKDYSTIRDNRFTNCSAKSLGGAIYVGRLATGIIANTHITGCRSERGGGIMIDSGLLDIDNTTWTSNQADVCGGAIYLESNAKANITKSIRVNDNKAPLGNAFCLTLGSLLSTTVDNYVNGTVYTDSTAIALAMQPFMARLQGNITALSPPSRLRLLTRQNFSLLEGDKFPPLEVGVKDLYDNDVVPDYKNVVIIQLTLLDAQSLNTKLEGDRIKAYLDPISKKVVFKNWTIHGQPGNYSLRIEPFLTDTFDPDKTLDYPIINVTITKCEYGSWKNTGANARAICLRLYYISPTMRFACSILAIIGCALTLVSGLGLYRYRIYPIVSIRKNQHLVFIGIGIMFSFIAVATQIADVAWSCHALAWFENIGILLVMTGIIFKILLMAQETQDVDVQDNTLKNTLFLLLLTSILLSVWTAEDVKSGNVTSKRISLFKGDYMPFILLDECSKNGFQQAAIFVRILLTLAAACVCWNFRDLKRGTEPMHLGIIAYNWIFFGSIVSLISEYGVADPDIAFLLKQASILIPSFICTLGLLTYKVWVCCVHKTEQTQLLAVVPNYEVGKSTTGDSIYTNALELSTVGAIMKPKETGSHIESDWPSVHDADDASAVNSHHISKRAAYTRETSNPPSQL